MSDDEVLRKVKERIVLQERVLKVIALDRLYLHVGSNSAASVHGAPAVGQLHFFVSGITDAVAIKVIIVKRHIAVVALDQASARGVVLGRSQRQSGVVRKR